jgi:Lrp/AsnC family leucine-responsive transcriptional regulator
MDALDLQILTSLDADARRPFADLARELNVSQPTIADRVQRLEARGILRGSMISLDYAKLGYPISAFIRIRAYGPKDKGLVQAMREIPQVIESHSVTGEDCVIARVVTRSVEELSAVLNRISVFGHSSTSIILDTLIPLRNPLVPQKPESALPSGADGSTRASKPREGTGAGRTTLRK